MSIKARLNLIVFLSVISIAGLYFYIIKITLEIDKELIQIEKIELFEHQITQLGLITEYYLRDQELRYINSWIESINDIEELIEQVDVFDQYHIVAESLPSIYGAFTLIVEIHSEPDLYPDEELRNELLNRASIRIRSDVMQLMHISRKIAQEHLENIRGIQVDQRIDFLLFLIPAIFLIILFAYRMRRKIINSLSKLTLGTKALSEGDLDQRIDLSGDDELGQLAQKFNAMTDKLQLQIQRERELSSELEIKAQELVSINKELNQFAYIASHDMKEPLRMVLNFMQLLEKKYKDQLDDKAQKYIHYAADGARRMTNLIDALLEYSRAGGRDIELKNTDAGQIVKEIEEMVKSDMQNQDAEIIFSDLPVVRAFPESLKMVFQNLITNALKYRHPKVHPVIQIDYSETDEYWQFTVSDNGIGIDEEYHEEIFELFRRLHSPEVYKGTGMGLSICKKIVEQHGGMIWVESEPGKGSKFCFTIKK